MRGKQKSELAAGDCPFHGASANAEMKGPTGCPISPGAAAFDVFDNAFQIDPAEALRWARAQEPVFYSPKMGYWVVVRYDDVKAVFRDNVTFSPSIVLEKITPSSSGAAAVLARYNYAMDRTLVNEDEPVHMERRRALMQSFVPENLAHYEPMVRRLTREFVDRFIDKGNADLVDEMLWEIPLTVALHFLGIPGEDMGILRKYSIAHTANTWGRPTSDQQIAVAEAVGNFWQFAGEVLEKMRTDPSGHGWMQYAIRQQKELPEIITDSYLHSIMMAGLVAAHETTAHASANALRLVLSNRDVWDEICADPGLIPNAVEECLRLVGSIVAWRRLVTADTTVGGVAIPKGAKILIVMASANHDDRHFENADELDIYRDNTTNHLTFGYGSHQCMGKNLARMEIRIFLEELTKRLPHMELVPDQIFEYLPNASIRGPDHLEVHWDRTKNPERRDPEILKRNLPDWSPGAHIDVVVGDYVRKYSLCGESADAKALQIAVLKSEVFASGSAVCAVVGLRFGSGGGADRCLHLGSNRKPVSVAGRAGFSRGRKLQFVHPSARRVVRVATVGGAVLPVVSWYPYRRPGGLYGRALSNQDPLHRVVHKLPVGLGCWRLGRTSDRHDAPASDRLLRNSRALCNGRSHPCTH
jgi:cytochrome P450